MGDNGVYLVRTVAWIQMKVSTLLCQWEVFDAKYVAIIFVAAVVIIIWSVAMVPDFNPSGSFTT